MKKHLSLAPEHNCRPQTPPPLLRRLLPGDPQRREEHERHQGEAGVEGAEPAEGDGTQEERVQCGDGLIMA